MIQAQPLSSVGDRSIDSQTDPLSVASGVYVTVHGHFYQPPRENPYLDAIERQPSASPFHDWNERVHHECYRPNAFARILNDRGELIEIVNNFEYLSFNIGPTLMSWLERYDVEVYQRILDADRKSCDRLNGHGNAIAQVYNHIIMPLANEHDKKTQIHWGIEDFRSRFGRDPEGIWLAETAVDYPTLAALVDAGIRFIILAPSQAQRCRPTPSHEHPNSSWIEVGGGQIDPIQPYRCFLPDGNPQQDFIDIFFYDGPISRDMGFNDVMASSQHFAGRIGQAVRGDHRPAQLISVATDGETFGHHKSGSEKALAYALTREFAQQGWVVTNYAHYLSLNPPTWEVELKPVTAWSCSHGVDRWQDDCGCGGGGLWHQQWRRPLRNALDWLREHLAQIFTDSGQDLFCDPWAARNDYIHVIRDRSPENLNQFWHHHQAHPLSPSEKVDSLRLLEMQRHALLMYTSCGWFFEELSRPEGVQILRYASRAMELAGDVAGVQLKSAFIDKLADAPSNVDCFKHGAEIYRQLVAPSQISIGQVAAHYAMSSLFTTYGSEQRVYCYVMHQLDYQIQRIGALKLAVGQIELTSELTRERSHLVFAVLHLGGWDFHCCIQPFSGRSAYAQAKEQLFQALNQASAAHMILTMSQTLGDQSYGLQDLFAEERHRIMRSLSRETLNRLDQLYTQVYRDNYGVLMAFHRDHLDVPQELQVAAEVAISHRATLSLRSLERETSDLSAANFDSCLTYLKELDAIASESDSLHSQLKLPQAKPTLERLILRSLWHLLHEFDPERSEQQIRWISRLITVGDRLHLGVSLDRAQELYVKHFYENTLPQILDWKSCQVDANFEPEESAELNQIRQILELGQILVIDINHWLEHLSY